LCGFAFAERILAMGWVDNDKYLLGIRKISLYANNRDEEAILDLGHRAVNVFYHKVCYVLTLSISRSPAG
jgi:hypothetical protein